MFRAHALTRTYRMGEAEVHALRGVAMVEDGLRPGARVIVYPSDALRDGAKIEITSGTR